MCFLHSLYYLLPSDRRVCREDGSNNYLRNSGRYHSAKNRMVQDTGDWFRPSRTDQCHCWTKLDDIKEASFYFSFILFAKVTSTNLLHMKHTNNKLKILHSFYAEGLQLLWNFSLQLYSVAGKERKTCSGQVRKSFSRENEGRKACLVYYMTCYAEAFDILTYWFTSIQVMKH